VGLRVKGGLGWHEQRSLGVETESEAGFAALAFGALGKAGVRAGTSGVRTGGGNVPGVYGPRDDLYQTWDDYWAIGASVMAGIAGADVDVRPLQIFDFVFGLVGIDFAHDDLATTRALELDRVEHALLEALSQVERARVEE
jgi:hypothetical protein